MDANSLISIDKIIPLIGVIIGYCLAWIKETINKKALRKTLLSSLWNDLIKIRDKPATPGALFMVMPYRTVLAENIISSGILGGKKFHKLLVEILELYGLWTTYNAFAQVVNTELAMTGNNAHRFAEIDILKQKSFSQAQTVISEIKEFYPNFLIDDISDDNQERN
ncbi:MAG: hypothetical protein HPY50_00445 [Firmicutes bacterium]|nr:hypothetical protein [Bacillota bacterium]